MCVAGCCQTPSLGLGQASPSWTCSRAGSAKPLPPGRTRCLCNKDTYLCSSKAGELLLLQPGPPSVFCKEKPTRSISACAWPVCRPSLSCGLVSESDAPPPGAGCSGRDSACPDFSSSSAPGNLRPGNPHLPTTSQVTSTGSLASCQPSVFRFHSTTHHWHDQDVPPAFRFKERCHTLPAFPPTPAQKCGPPAVDSSQAFLPPPDFAHLSSVRCRLHPPAQQYWGARWADGHKNCRLC